MLNTVLNILLVILIIAAIVLAILYFLGNKLQKRQLEQQQMLDAAAQTVSLLVIDKKKLKLTQAGLPKMVVDQTPKYMRWTKVPIVKAKIGPKIVTLIADARVFECLPVKTEAKVILSGIYITQIKSVRGGSIPTPPNEKGIFRKITVKMHIWGVKKQPAPGWDRLFFIMHNSLYDNVHHQATYPFTGRTAHLPGYGSLTYVRN